MSVTVLSLPETCDKPAPTKIFPIPSVQEIAQCKCRHSCKCFIWHTDTLEAGVQRRLEKALGLP